MLVAGVTLAETRVDHSLAGFSRPVAAGRWRLSAPQRNERRCLRPPVAKSDKVLLRVDTALPCVCVCEAWQQCVSRGWD